MKTFVPPLAALTVTLSVTSPLCLAHDDHWMVNETNERSPSISAANSSRGALVNVRSVDHVTHGNKVYTRVRASGIPNYTVVANQDLIDELNSRPNATSDFVNGVPNVSVGDTIEFGEDIGYNSSIVNCLTTGGYGYWPPGPSCPQDTSKVGKFPDSPTSNSGDCDTGLGAIGYFVNGTSIYNWNDGMTYNNAGVWHNTAAKAEVHDLDICSGHAALSDYHHHTWSSCLADQLGENRDAHSPVYGYAADGYPVHGPWYADGVLAVSAWQTRDYDDPASSTGCGTAYERSCLMVDPYDPSQGTVAAASDGPDTNTVITSQSGNPVSAASGLYAEDYYYDSSLTALGGKYLDEHNGHDHDAYGYHYHLTVEDDGGDLTPTFPFSFGPAFYGELDNHTVADCSL